MRPYRLAALVLVGLLSIAASAGASAGARHQVARGSVADPTAITMRHGDLTITFSSPLAIDAAADCSSGKFCFWGNTGFTGTKYTWGTNGWHDLRGFAGPFKSLFNNRGRTAYVHQSDQGPPEFCVDPHGPDSAMPSSYWHPAWLYLAATQTACG